MRVVLWLPHRPQTDVLLVVDSGPAMAPHRATLRARAHELAEDLDFASDRADLHVASVTADLGAPIDGCTPRGDDAVLRAIPGVDGQFAILARLPDGSRQRNYTRSLEEVVADMLDAGSTGCAIPQPLEAMRRALQQPANAGFRRPEARLFVVFVTSQDDCSFADGQFVAGPPTSCSLRDGLVPVDEYAAFLRGLVPFPAGVAVAGVVGPPTPAIAYDGVLRPSCTAGPIDASSRLAAPRDEARTALPAVRVHALLDRFPGRNIASSICQLGLGLGIGIFNGFDDHAGPTPCFRRPFGDVDPTTPGVQPECAAWLERDDRTGTVTLPMPPCERFDPATADRCWAPVLDPSACPRSPQLDELDTHGLRVELSDWYAHDLTPLRAVVECVSR